MTGMSGSGINIEGGKDDERSYVHKRGIDSGDVCGMGTSCVMAQETVIHPLLQPGFPTDPAVS